jgi:RNA polymerase sporulation-specific sigma factor
MSALTDEELVLQAVKGDDNALELLAVRYFALIGMRASAYCGQSEIESDDLGQEGFIGLLSAIRSYDPSLGASFRTFATLCIDRRMIDTVRHTLRKSSVPASAGLPLGDGDDILAPTNGGDPESAVIARDDFDRVMKKVRSVTSDFERSVLALYLRGMSYRDIAGSLGCSAKSVDNAMWRLRRKLSESGAE